MAADPDRARHSGPHAAQEVTHGGRIVYLGLAGALLGAAVLIGSITPFVVIPAFIALIADRFIVREEAMLERTFGSQYLDYKARVRRWL